MLDFKENGSGGDDADDPDEKFAGHGKYVYWAIKNDLDMT